MDETKEVRQIPVEDIIPNRFQPRINFDEKALNDLSASIKQHGIIQPLVVRPLGDKFEIIAGERRYKAATLAGFATVPAIVTAMDDNTSAEVALIENVQRKDLSSIEEAKSYKNMLERGNMTQEELAKKMGLSQSTIANKLRLLNLTEEVQNALMHEQISERHARALLQIPDKQKQIDWLNRIINERLTVRQLDLAIKDELLEKKKNQEDIPIVNIDPDIDSIINNAVDINPVVENKPEIDVFSGILDNKGKIDEQQVEVLDNNVEVKQEEKPQMPNKFFNFLEDQEVNMNMESNEEDSNIHGFSDFTPEFIDAQENDFAQEKNKENIVNNSNELSGEVDSLDDDFIVSTEEKNEEQDELSLSEALENTDFDNETEKSIDEVKENKEIPEEFIFDDEELDNVDNIVEKDIESENQAYNDLLVEDNESDNIISNEASEEITNQDNDIKIDPIPIMEGENIVDPAAYYDTLEPDFMDKVKEQIGLDLKTAINSYRDLTSKLNSSGFNIFIEEADTPGKYHIEIDINKE